MQYTVPHNNSPESRCTHHVDIDEQKQGLQRCGDKGSDATLKERRQSHNK